MSPCSRWTLGWSALKKIICCIRLCSCFPMKIKSTQTKCSCFGCNCQGLMALMSLQPWFFMVTGSVRLIGSVNIMWRSDWVMFVVFLMYICTQCVHRSQLSWFPLVVMLMSLLRHVQANIHTCNHTVWLLKYWFLHIYSMHFYVPIKRNILVF